VQAEEIRATCVLMGSHNKGPVAEFFMGSVSQYVSHHSKASGVVRLPPQQGKRPRRAAAGCHAPTLACMRHQHDASFDAGPTTCGRVRVHMHACACMCVHMQVPVVIVKQP
jgi:hypothetical protein